MVRFRQLGEGLHGETLVLTGLKAAENQVDERAVRDSKGRTRRGPLGFGWRNGKDRDRPGWVVARFFPCGANVQEPFSRMVLLEGDEQRRPGYRR